MRSMKKKIRKKHVNVYNAATKDSIFGVSQMCKTQMSTSTRNTIHPIQCVLTNSLLNNMYKSSMNAMNKSGNKKEKSKKMNLCYLLLYGFLLLLSGVFEENAIIFGHCKVHCRIGDVVSGKWGNQYMSCKVSICQKQLFLSDSCFLPETTFFFFFSVRYLFVFFRCRFFMNYKFNDL